MRSCTFAIALWLAACHTGATTSSTTTETTREHTLTSDRIDAPIVAQSSSKPDALVRAEPLPARPMRLVHALASELPRAELRRGASWLADFGAPSDAQYTLGGWQTSAGDSITLEAASAMLVRGKTLKLFVPAESAAAQRLSLRVRSFATTSILVYVGGKKLADAALGGDALEDVELTLPRGALEAGDNLIELRVGRTGSARGMAKGVSRAGFALDHISLSDAAAPATTVAPPSPRELAPAADTLQIPRDVRLSYTLEVPTGAELHATVRGGATGTRLRVSAKRDGAPAVELGSVDVGPGERALNLSLAPLAGDLARLELAAVGGAVTLVMPVVVEPSEANDAVQKPIKNVVLMLIDTLRADKLKNYNPKSRVRTPGLSRFLENAVTMHDARSQENWTKPSVATLLSSLFPWQHNAYTGDAKVPASVQLLPEYFQDRGFVTAAFIANGYVSDKFGFGQGWSDYRNYIREGRRSIGQEVAGDVLSWLDTRPKDKPFFLYVHTIDPHVPYRPPANFLAMYDPAPYTGPVNFSNSATLLEQIKLGKLPLNERDKVRLQALYDGEISYHDVHFAAIIDGLAKRGLADDTMIVITSDHGEEFWDHGSVGHGHSVYDELLRIPMIVRIPGLTEGNATVRGDVGLVDVAPTILETLKLPVPDGMYGRSFLPEITGKRSGTPRATASGFMTSFRTLASGRYKLVQRGVDKATLYDLRVDPGETRDVAAAKPIALRHTRSLLGLTLAGSGSETATARKVHKQEKTEIDAATEAQLRALGYVGTSRP